MELEIADAAQLRQKISWISATTTSWERQETVFFPPPERTSSADNLISSDFAQNYKRVNISCWKSPSLCNFYRNTSKLIQRISQNHISELPQSKNHGPFTGIKFLFYLLACRIFYFYLRRSQTSSYWSIKIKRTLLFTL